MPPDFGDLPPWCAWSVGSSPVLLIAPHGGRREAPHDGARPAKVNDVHTADLTRAMARPLAASFVVNEALDRNRLDLNRISQVVRHAPWFIDLIEHLAGRILLRHPQAEVLFVHGWNVVQPKCDVGVGAAMANESEALALESDLTATPDYVAGRLAGLRRLAERAGLRVSYGERYPARHRNNLLQLFRRHPVGETARGGRLAEWAAFGRLQAVQLELGIPLRSPGSVRDRFLAVAADAFRSAPDAGTESLRQVQIERDAEPGPAALEFFDPASHCGLRCTVSSRAGGAFVAGRLLVFPGGRRAALFVGEDRDARALGRDGPRFERCGDGQRLEFDGQLLQLEDGRASLHLEDAFSTGRLHPFRIDLAFSPTAAPHYGRIVGEVRSQKRSWRIDCCGFARSTTLEREADDDPAPLLALAASFGPALALRARSSERRRTAVLQRRGSEQERPLAAVSADLAPDGMPRRFELVFADGDELLVEPLSQLAFRRPLAGGGRARTTLGVATFLSSHGRGFGFYEYSHPE